MALSGIVGVVRQKWIDVQMGHPSFRRMRNLFRYFNSSPEVIRLAVMMYVGFVKLTRFTPKSR